jgi:hypothetical protein
VLGSRLTVLEAINEVARRLNLRQLTATTGNSWAQTMIGHLNDVCSDLADFSTWEELMASATFTLVCGQATYQVSTTASNSAAFQQILSIEEVHLSGRIPPLEPISNRNEFRMLIRTNSIGTPSRFCPMDLDGEGNQKVGLFPRPGSTWAGSIAHVHYQVLPPRYEAGTDDAVVVPFPGRVLVAGLVAAAILDEAGGTETQQWKAAHDRYMVARRAASGRRMAKTGDYTRFQPGMTQRS